MKLLTCIIISFAAGCLAGILLFGNPFHHRQYKPMEFHTAPSMKPMEQPKVTMFL